MGSREEAELGILFSDFTCGALFNQYFNSRPAITANETLFRKVKFDKRLEIWNIEKASEMSRKQKNALWYPDPGDNSGSRSRKNRLRLLMCQSHTHDSDKDTTFESESRSDEDSYTYMSRRSTSDENEEAQSRRLRFPVAAVLEEQQNQREAGTNDPERISKMYKHCSSHSQILAQIRAAQDEADIQDYVSKDSSRKKPLAGLFRRKKGGRADTAKTQAQTARRGVDNE